MGMPFGMIFAIILIVVFIVIAFIAVRGFITVGSTASVELFYSELQDAVSDAYQAQSSQKPFKIDLPSGITHVCFANLSLPARGALEEYAELEFFDVYGANTFLLPINKAEGSMYKSIDYLDVNKIISNRNPYCVSVDQDLIIKKDFYDRLVTVE